MKAYTMIYKNQTLAGGFGGAEAAPSQDIYSVEEQVVGRWIDGKPIYRTTLIYTTSNATGRTDEAISSDNGNIYDFLIRRYGAVQDSDGVTTPIGFSDYATSGNFLAADVFIGGNNNLILRRNGHRTANATAKIVLEYTKTTDEAASELPEIV